MNTTKKKGIVELYYDFQKAYDNLNHVFLEELFDMYSFTIGIQRFIIEMMARWKNPAVIRGEEKSEKTC